MEVKNENYEDPELQSHVLPTLLLMAQAIQFGENLNVNSNDQLIQNIVVEMQSHLGGVALLEKLQYHLNPNILTTAPKDKPEEKSSYN